MFLTKEQKRDYPEFVGKKLIYKSSILECVGVVVGFDYHIGVSIVKEGNPKKFLNCCYGPLAPNRGSAYDRGQKDIDEWDELFLIKLRQMSDGIVYSPRVSPYPIVGSNVNGLTARSCPFGQ